MVDTHAICCLVTESNNIYIIYDLTFDLSLDIREYIIYTFIMYNGCVCHLSSTLCASPQTGSTNIYIYMYYEWGGTWDFNKCMQLDQ